MEEIELPNQEKIRRLEKRKNYLGMLEADIIKQMALKEKVRKK